MSKDYFIYTDWNKSNNHVVIVMCKRSSLKDCWRSSEKNYGHVSILYHEWGTDLFLVKEKSTIHACWSISQKKEVSKSKCSAMASSIKGADKMQNYCVPQGYTRHGNFFIRGFGNNGGCQNRLVLYNKNRTKVLKNFELPNSVNEVEDVMVDGSTGTVYFTTNQYDNRGKRFYTLYKVADSVFNKWIKPISGSSGSTSSSTSDSSVDIFGSDPYDPEKDNITIRDETYSEEVPVSTYDGIVDTNFFGSVKDEDGCGVYTTLSLIIDILSIGIGIAAAIGITLSGITYLTAKGDVTKTTKAKRRIYEIVIGIAAYAVIYALLTFLTPEFNPELKVCKALTEEEKVQIRAENKARAEAEQKKQEELEEAKNTKNTSSAKSTDSGSNTPDVPGVIKGADLEGATETGKLMLQSAEWSARYMAEHKFIYFQYDPSNGYKNKNIKSGYGPKGGVWPDIWPHNWTQAKEWRMTHCSGFAVLVLKKTGLFNGHKVKVFSAHGQMTSYFWGDKEAEKIFNKHFEKRKGNGETIAKLVKEKKLGPGDIFGTSSTKAVHTMIYAGKYKGKHYIYEVSAPVNHVLTYGLGKTNHYKGYLHPVISGNTHVGEFFHAK